MKLLTLINAHDSIGWHGTGPEYLLEESLGLAHHHLEESQPNAQPFLGQQDTLVGNKLLLQREGRGGGAREERGGVREGREKGGDKGGEGEGGEGGVRMGSEECGRC